MSDKFDRDQVEQYNTGELSEDERAAEPRLARVLVEQATKDWSWDDWQYWCRSEERMTASELLRIWEALP